MKKTAEEVLAQMIALFTYYLDELQDVDKNKTDDQFAYGEKTAFVEGLEMIADWEYAEEFGLNFEVEERFAL